MEPLLNRCRFGARLFQLAVDTLKQRREGEALKGRERRSCEGI